MISYNHISEKKNVQFHYNDTDAFVLSIISKNIIKDLENFEDILDFCNVNEIHEIYSNKIKNVTDKFKRETPKQFCFVEFMYAFSCGDDSKKKLKGICKSQSKNVKSEE